MIILHREGAMKIIDDGTKKLTALNRNYFFIVTVAFVVLCVTLHARLGNEWSVRMRPYEINRYGFKIYKGNSLLYSLYNAFSHANWQHCLLNMLCFFVCGCWLERRKGSLKFLILLLLIIFITSRAITAVCGDAWVGYSGVNYGLYAFIIVDFLFSLKNGKRDKFNIICGSIVTALIYFAMCFNGGVERVSFAFYPSDLIYNAGHKISFWVILLAAFVVKIFKYLKNRDAEAGS